MDVIYRITSPIGKVYIGRTNDFNKRMADHKRNAFVKKLPNTLYKAINKYGWDNMIKEIICEVDAAQSSKLEEEFILAHNSVKTGYNDTYLGKGGDVWKDRRDTDEYMEWIIKMKNINQTNKMHGKSHSIESKEKQKLKAKGRFTLEWFIDRNGQEEGELLYKKRCESLKNRNLKKDNNGRFVKSSK
jgi:group I intron endonuclease